MSVTATKIDPGNAMKDQQLTYQPSNAQATAQSAGPAQTASFDPATAQQASFHGMDPGSMGSAAAAQGHGGERLGFGIGAQSVMKNAMKAFESQLPGMNIDFADKSDQLAQRTSAMGRTGSGLFNRDTGYISDRARASREGMLGNLSFQAATSDQAADLQAQIQTQQLLNSQEQRFSGASLQNAQMATNANLQNAQMSGQAAMQNQALQNNMSQFNAGQANNMGQFNSQMGLNAGQFNAGQQNNMGQFNAQLGQQADMFNVGNQIQQGQFGANFAQGQQGYQQGLAQDAQNDLYRQMQLAQQGFGQDPTNAMMHGAGGLGGMAGMYGAQAGQANQQIGQGANHMMQMLGMGGQQGGMTGHSGGGNWGGPSQGYQRGGFDNRQLFGGGPQGIGLQPSQPQGFAAGWDPRAPQMDPAGFQQWYNAGQQAGHQMPPMPQFDNPGY